mgnify:CR=1 FL=1
MLTLVFLSFHSEHHIRRLVKSINSKYPIIIIENSANRKLKSELENLYKNVSVVICEENLGFSKGMNLGIGFSTSTKKQECWLSNCNPPTPRCFDFSWITNRSSCSTPLRPTRGHWIQFHGATLSSLKLTAWIQATSYIHSCIILRNLSPCLQI